MSKPTHSNLTKQNSNSGDRGFASDTELDSLLEEVEKIQEEKVKAARKSLSKNSACDRLFTKEDEKALKEIFDNVEKRKQEFEDLRLAASGSDIKENDCESVTSKNSNESETDDDLSSSKVSDVDSSERESTDDEVDLTSDDEENNNAEDTKQKHPKKNHKTSLNSSDSCSTSTSKNEKILPKKDAIGQRGKASEFMGKNHNKKVQNSSNCNPEVSRKSDEELDSMMEELLEF